MSTRIVIVLGSAALLAACGGGSSSTGGMQHGQMGMQHGGMEMHHGEMEHGGPTPSDHVVPAGEAHVGDTTTCPVSGERFVVTEQSPHSDYEGHTYYFCCPGCIDRFQASPAHYAHPAS